MSVPRPTLLVRGSIVVEALPDRLETVEAIGIADGRVVAVGAWDDVASGRGPRTRVVDARPSAVIPGLHDFHIHLVALARTASQVRLDDAVDGSDVARRLLERAGSLAPGEWLSGRGWTEAQLATLDLEVLGASLGAVPALLASHDGHSAWASPATLARAGISAETPDPDGGRIERDGLGRPTGVLRETAIALVAGLVPEPRGDELRGALDGTLRELAALGITGASEAGDYTADDGVEPDADLGDSASTLLALADLVDGRLRFNLGIPADGLRAASRRGLRTGSPFPGRRTIRLGWAKEFADGALGSGTAALSAPIAGGAGPGILRVTAEELDALFVASRDAGIALAVHAIGDRAATVVLDALARAPASPGMPQDRMEHVQLVRPPDVARFAELRMTASVQPIHAAADRDLVETQWRGRESDAYAWRRLAEAGVLLAAGSDAPIESVNPWVGTFAAVHRRLPTDKRGDWRTDQALSVAEALRAYTRGPAQAIGAEDEGHLRIGARADLAVLDADLATLNAADERLAAMTSTLTLVDGQNVHRR